MAGRAWVGCSGWQYKDWRGIVYPQTLPMRRWFEHYSTLFRTVEINNTFYRLPPIETVEKWHDQAPDGFLYAGTGDGQNGDNAQNKNSLGGKVLRMTKDGKAAPGNPFNSLVYSYGHRNVQGLTWVGSQLYISDIGASKVDELNKIDAGKNYGWPTCEGSCGTAGMTNPVKQWPTSQATPSGITTYKGMLYMASLKGGTFKLTPNGAGGKIYTNLGRTRDEVAGPDGSL